MTGAAARTLFRDIAKQVHPDVNDRPDATKMMQEALKHKDNGNMLLRLAREWGLKLDGTFDEKAFNSKANFNEKVYHAVVGAIVVWTFRYKRKMRTVRGVIIRTRLVKKGKMRGFTEYTIYDFRTRQIWKTKAYGRNYDFNVVGKADDREVLVGIDAHKNIKRQKKRNQELRDNMAFRKFRSLGLMSQFDYEIKGIEVLVNYKSGPKWKKLIRTTKKCVYVREAGGRTRRVNIDAILRKREI